MEPQGWCTDRREESQSHKHWRWDSAAIREILAASLDRHLYADADAATQFRFRILVVDDYVSVLMHDCPHVRDRSYRVRQVVAP